MLEEIEGKTISNKMDSSIVEIGAPFFVKPKSFPGEN